MLLCKLSVAMVIFFCQQKVQREDDSYKIHGETTSIKFIIIKAFLYKLSYILVGHGQSCSGLLLVLNTIVHRFFSQV